MSRRNPTEIVVTGVGVVSSIGLDVPSFTQGLRAGRSGISPIEAFDASGMRSQHAGEIKSLPDDGAGCEADDSARFMDRSSRLALRAADEAVRMSGFTVDEDERDIVGVAMGSCGGGYLGGYSYLARKARDGGRPRHTQARRLLDVPLHSAASRIAIRYGLFGPVSLLSNACASSAIALTHALQQIRRGRAVAMLAGGYETLTPLTSAGFGAMRNTSKTNRIRPFDAKRDGILLGEGSAVLVLERADRARARGATVLARVLGGGISSDTYHMTAPDPSGSGAAAAIERALEDAGLDAGAVDYVNAHGTGTLHSDRMETNAIKKALGDHATKVRVSSTKSMVGHTLGAAGAIELVASMMGMAHGFAPPTINYENPDPHCDLDYVPNHAHQMPLGHVVSNSFGFGGTNCSVVIGHPDAA